MSARIVLEMTGFGLRAAALDGDRLIEVRDADEDEPRVSEALFAARVTAVDPKLNAAFLDVGMAMPGLIVAKDARAAAGVAERRPVRELLREGQRLIVQGLREPAGDKGARFTSDVKLLGFALVHAPLTAGVEAAGGGRRAEDPSRERSRALFPDGRFTLRRHAASLGDEALRAEARQLADRWARLQAAVRTARPGRLPEPESMLERLVRGLLDLAPRTIAIADPALARELERLAAGTPTLPRLEIERLAPGEPAFDQTGVAEALETALGPEVPLPGGGRLLIESTAACVAIDVDGGGRSPLEANLGAVGEIARQVRLRNLGGTIVVDFVDLPHKHERQRLEDALKKAFRHDPAPLDIHPMSPLGIVQISRARRGQPLADRFRAPCRCCDGSGQVTSPRAAAERLLVELGLRTRPAATVRLGTELARFLAAAGAPGWRRLVARLGHEPALRADPTLGATAFLIEEAGRER
jgi:ribonuclease E/ribonuclease G